MNTNEDNFIGLVIICPRCGHKWVTLSKACYITCSMCRKMIKIRDHKGITQHTDDVIIGE